MCQLVEPSEEHNLLREIMFSKNFRSASLEKSRRETLGLVLNLIKECRELSIDFTSALERARFTFQIEILVTV